MVGHPVLRGSANLARTPCLVLLFRSFVPRPPVESRAMATVRPFAALRPAPERAAQVSAVPYDVVSTEEARQLASGNPLSFLHVTRAEIDLPADTDPYSSAVYTKARENLATLLSRAPLVVEDQ